MVIKTLIVEDDLVAQMLLEFYSSNIPEISLTRKFDTVASSLDYLKTHQPDLIFLDIELKDGKGWEILKDLTEKTAVVITTREPAYGKTAIEKYGISDVLIKPIQLSNFLQVVKNVIAKKK